MSDPIDELDFRRALREILDMGERINRMQASILRLTYGLVGLALVLVVVILMG